MTSTEPRKTTDTTAASAPDGLEHRLAAVVIGSGHTAGHALDAERLAAEVGADRADVEPALRALVADRLVEADPDGGFRVASPTPAEYDEALQIVFGFAELAARWAVPVMDDAEVRGTVDALERVRAKADDAEPTGLASALDDLLGPLLTATPNRFFEDAAVGVLTRCQFLNFASARFVFWDVRDHVDAFRDALERRDGEAAAAGIGLLGRAVRDHVDQQRAASPSPSTAGD